MLDLDFLEEVIPNIDEWTYADLKKIKILSVNEILDNLKICCEANKGVGEVDIDIEVFTNLCITAISHTIKKQEK